MPRDHLPRGFEWTKRTGIRNAATALEISAVETAIAPIRRRSTLRFLDESGPGLVVCPDQRSDDVMALSAEVDGRLLLLDVEEPEHQFLTEGGRRPIGCRLSEAWEVARREGEAATEWGKEWELLRVSDSSGGSGSVSIVAPVAECQEAAAIASVSQAIGAARRKLETKRWARHSAVALHAGEQRSVVDLLLFEAAPERLDAADVQPFEQVSLVAGMRVRPFAF